MSAALVVELAHGSIVNAYRFQQERSAMTTISQEAKILTLINTFTVSREKQQALIDLLDRVTEDVMKKQPGFISANIHRSLDGTKVANYAQWRSKSDFEAMQRDPVAGAHMKQAAELAEKFEPIVYEVSSVHGD